MSTDQSITLTIHVDTSAFTRAMGTVIANSEAAAAHLAGLHAHLQQQLTTDTAALARRRRRLRSHVWETPSASRMHAAYHRKTAHRNRRRR